MITKEILLKTIEELNMMNKEKATIRQKKLITERGAGERDDECERGGAQGRCRTRRRRGDRLMSVSR